jgi:hypothetical protein
MDITKDGFCPLDLEQQRQNQQTGREYHSLLLHILVLIRVLQVLQQVFAPTVLLLYNQEVKVERILANKIKINK